MQRILYSLIFTAPIVCAADLAPLAEAGQRLQAALEKEVLALEGVNTAADVGAALVDIRASLQEQKSLFSVDEKDLWLYIENTASLKDALIELLERLSVQYARMYRSNYYDSGELREIFASQIEPPAEDKAGAEETPANGCAE